MGSGETQAGQELGNTSPEKAWAEQHSPRWGPQQLALLIEAPAVELCMIPLPPCPPILPSGLFSLIESQTIKLHSLYIYSWRNHLFQGMRGSKRGSLSAPASLFLFSYKESDCVFLGACTATTI